jgi:hypothetical protein
MQVEVSDLAGERAPDRAPVGSRAMRSFQRGADKNLYELADWLTDLHFHG